MSNVPEIIYKYTDKALLPFIKLLVPQEVISRRLLKEEEYFDPKDELTHAVMLLTAIHERASSMVAHLSLMLALCIFILQSDQLQNNSFIEFIVTLDALIYIVLVLLTVRGLRSFGLDKDYETKKFYIETIKKELTVKFSILQIVNSVTIIATIILVFTMIYHLIIK